MKQWARAAALIVIILATAFALSGLAVEWRQETVDIAPLATEVGEIRELLETTPTPRPTPTPTATPAAEPASATAEAGSVVEWQGTRLTVDRVNFSYATSSPRISFTLENVSAPLSLTSAFSGPRVVGSDGSLCRSGILSYVDNSVSLMPGEKTTFEVYWECPGRVRPRTLTLGTAVVLEFPPG